MNDPASAEIDIAQFRGPDEEYGVCRNRERPSPGVGRIDQHKDFTNQRYRWGKRIDESVKATNRRKSSVRAKVEHVFGVIKRVFGFQKVCYRGLAKNLHRLEATAALANLFLVRRRLLNA
jgi:IS5 family transposase